MEELTDLGSTEAITGRGQEAGIPPAACTGAGVGEQLGGVDRLPTGVNASSDQEDLQSDSTAQ